MRSLPVTLPQHSFVKGIVVQTPHDEHKFMSCLKLISEARLRSSGYGNSFDMVSRDQRARELHELHEPWGMTENKELQFASSLITKAKTDPICHGYCVGYHTIGQRKCDGVECPLCSLANKVHG